MPFADDSFHSDALKTCETQQPFRRQTEPTICISLNAGSPVDSVALSLPQQNPTSYAPKHDSLPGPGNGRVAGQEAEIEAPAPAVIKQWTFLQPPTINVHPSPSDPMNPPSPRTSDVQYQSSPQRPNHPESPKEDPRLSRLHFGPFYLGAPVATRKSQKQRRPSNNAGTPNQQPIPQSGGMVEKPRKFSDPFRFFRGKEDNTQSLGVGARAPSSHRRASLFQRFSSNFSYNGQDNNNTLSDAEGSYFILDDVDQSGQVSSTMVDLSSLGGDTMGLPRASINRLSKMFGSEKHKASDDTTSHSDTDNKSRRKSSVPKAAGDALGSELQPKTSAGLSPSHEKENKRVSVLEAAGLVRKKPEQKMGQRLAEKEQAVVEIKETPTIDLSSLEGTKRQSQVLSASSKSYFYPADPEQPNWKPFSMRSLYIILLIVLSLLLAGIQEWLCQISTRRVTDEDGLLKFNRTAEVSLGNFFCWKYLPTIVFVAYGVLWQITDYETKRLEPFYQLSQPSGSCAKTSMNLDYVSAWIIFAPFQAFRHRHWAVFCSSVGALFATIIAPSLQNPAVIFVENPNCHELCPGGESRYFVRIDPIWSRLLTASLLVLAIFGCVLFIQLRKKSGLLSNPQGIAGIASMATKSHILSDFQGMDEARHDEIHRRLKHHRYILYKSTIWHGEYIKQSTPDSDSDSDTSPKVSNPHPIILRAKPGLAFLAFLTFCLALVPVINFTPANTIAITQPWLPVLVATVIKQLWTTLEFAVRTIEPFYVLSKGNASPNTTLTLDYRGTPYGLLPFHALRNGHYIVALAGLGSVLSDILTVTVSSFSVNGQVLIRKSQNKSSPSSSSSSLQQNLLISEDDQTLLSFLVSVAISLAILLFLITSASLIYSRRRHPFLPRQPSTIASVLAFIYQSRMLDDFVDTERSNTREVEGRLATGGKRYGLGWFKGRDGRPHCAVDQEPMLSRYAHGMSYIRATAPWEDI